MPAVLALLVSDVHLQARPPIARSAEPDWFEAMARPLDEISVLAQQYQCPVLYAGDIFDRWCAGPEVIAFALRNLPKGYAIPGQHDLPNHNYAEVHRSAYGVMVEAGHLTDVPPGETFYINNGLSVTGWPWGYPPTPLAPERKSKTNPIAVALVHQYLWMRGFGYPGAPETARLSHKARGGLVAALQGYNVVVFGDNHQGFIAPPRVAGDLWVINCGGLMRRKTDEIDYRPGIGLLLADGTVQRHYLNIAGEKITARTAAEEAVAEALNVGAFVEELRGLGAGDALDFTGAMKKFFTANNTPVGVRNVILEAME